MPRGPKPRRGWPASEQGPHAATRGREHSCPLRCSPHLKRNPCQELYPVTFLPQATQPLPAPFSFLIWAQLSLWSLGQRHFWKHRCQWWPQQLRAPEGYCHSPWKTGQSSRRSPVKSTAGRAGPSGTLETSSTGIPLAPQLCYPV
jgi:hypothetical protein